MFVNVFNAKSISKNEMLEERKGSNSHRKIKVCGECIVVATKLLRSMIHVMRQKGVADGR